MRGYFVSVIRMLAKVIPHPAASRAFISRHRMLVFLMASALLVISTTALMTTKHFFASSDSQSTNNQLSSEGSAGVIEVAPGVSGSQQITNIVSPSGGNMHTSVMVNGKSIEVPKNGSIHKTITSDDGGTTEVHISSSGNAINSNTFTSSSNVQITTNSSEYNSQTDN